MHDGGVRYRVASAEIVSDVIDGETVLVDLASGSYFTANATGGAIWSLIARGGTEAEVMAELGRRFIGDEDAIRASSQEFVERLCTEGLLLPAHPGEVVAAAHSSTAGPTPARTPFTAPLLTRYTDMEDLLSLDPIHEVDELGWPHVKPPDAR
jgi:hypothetical protein